MLRTRLNILILVVSLLFLIFGAVPLLTNRIQVSALSGNEFQAGRIIDDSVFFGINNISPQDIQLFLNSKVPTCDTSGSQPYGGTTRAAYGASRGYPAPYTCLKDYSQDTPSKPAESGLCNQYYGGAKSAAQIIFDVSQACGVNARVLLVLLQKEQSLITDDWPWSIQYRSATGYGCPDTAPCDAEYYGFFNQVYSAARQFRRYQRDSSSFGYRPNRNNYIQYNPNTGCGGTNVYIQNQATAGLYNYTPYQPNAAALSNLYGEGDGCSAYGNRNFWRMFNDWFGGVSGGAYEWQLVAQEAYADAARTIPLTSETTVVPNGTIYLRVKTRNTGYLPWYNANVRIGTSSPRDRSSAFYDTSWLGQSRPARLSESAVASSEVGTFDFAIHAPSTPGTYREYFQPLIEGAMWLKDIGMYYEINVVSPVAATNTTRFELNPGQELKSGEFILSPDKQSALTTQTDGNLVLYSNYSRPMWHTGTGASGVSRLVMQTDGNLVLYNQAGTVLWNAGTNGNPNAKLVLQTDGNLVVYSASNVALWSAGVSHVPNHLQYVNRTLRTGLVFPGQVLETADRKYKLVFQEDGNLVLYSPNRAIWSSGTWGKANSKLVMQGDGNLVLYSSQGQPIWYSNTSRNGESTLVVQTDGNLVLYRSDGLPTWTSHTAGKN